MKGIWALPWWNKRVHPPTVTIFYEFAQVWKIIFQTSCLEFHSSGGCISGWNVEFLQHISNVRHSVQAETPSKSTRHVLHKMRGDAATGHAAYDWFFHILSNVHHCHHHLWGYKPIYTIIVLGFAWVCHGHHGRYYQKKKWRRSATSQDEDPPMIQQLFSIYGLWPIIFLRKTFEALVAAPLMLIPSPYF